MDAKIHPAKYIPPHRRNPSSEPSQGNQPESRSRGRAPGVVQARALDSDPQRPQRYSWGNSDRNFKYTSHASKRMGERKITAERVQHTVEKGSVLKNEESATYINETTQVILGRDAAVITCLDNKRNTDFNVLNATKELEKALLEKALHQNNSHAMSELGELYLKGSLGGRDVHKAYDWFLKAADRGSSHAMCLLAKMYQRGDLGDKNPQLAEAWMLKAAQRNNKYALAVLGQEYLSEYASMKFHPGKDAIQEKAVLDRAIHFLEQSAKKGSTRAMWHLGKICQEGYKGEPDLPKAIAYYAKAARQGSPASLNSLNALVAKGLYDPDTFEEVLDAASRLVARTSSDIAVQLGLEQVEGRLGKNPQRGFYILEQAAEKNHVDAVRLLVKCYQKGRGGPPNLERAHYWTQRLKALYELAANQGNTEVLWELGRLHLKGSLGTKDFKQAEYYFIKSAETEDPEAAYALGMLYKEGVLGKVNLEQSGYWIKKSIEIQSLKALEGDVRAAIAIGKIYLYGDLGAKDYTQALHWFQIANKESNTKALKAFAETYSALGLHKKAIECYEEVLALQKNCPATKPLKLAKTLTHLGWYSCRYLKEYETAKAYHTEAQIIYTLLKEFEAVANTFNNLGHVYMGLGALEKAKQAYTAGLNLYRETSQEPLINIAESFNGLGDVSRMQGQFEQARGYYEEALELCKSFEEDSHEHAADSLKGLGKLSQTQGDFNAAKASYEKALTIIQAIFGNEHPETAMALELLENLCLEMVQDNLAQSYQEQIITIYSFLKSLEKPSSLAP